MRRPHLVLTLCVLLSGISAAQGQRAGMPPTVLSPLEAAVEVARDPYGIAHIKAGNDHDLYFM